MSPNIQLSCYALFPFTAMSVVVTNVARQLIKLGYNTTIFPLSNKDQISAGDYPEFGDIIVRKSNPEAINIFFSYPDAYAEIKCKVNVGFTGCDTSAWYKTVNPISPATMCNKYCDYMLTPSKFSQDIMEKNGVTIPIILFPHGIDPDIFTLSKRNKEFPFKFLYCGEPTTRKGVPELISAFTKTFDRDKDFNLTIRSNPHATPDEISKIGNLVKGFDNIKFIISNGEQSSLNNYYQSSHVYCYPSKGDWFGLTPIEALSTGLPVIATRYNGYYEHMRGKILSIGYTIEDVQHEMLRGKWAVPDISDLCEKLKMSVDVYTDLSRKSYWDGKRMRSEMSWKNMTEKYLVPFLDEVIEKHYKKNIKGKEEIMENTKKLTVAIPTKDRMESLLILLQSLMFQTYNDFDILIVNDNVVEDMNHQTLQNMFNVLKEYGHDVKVIDGDRKGPHFGGQKIFENSETSFVFRTDDDVTFEPWAIENLMTVIASDEKIGAVGPLYILPFKPVNEQLAPSDLTKDQKKEIGSVKWNGDELFLTGWLQNVMHPNKDIIPVEHLNSGFLYRREALEKIGGYFLGYSKVGHREETDTSYRIHIAGYKLFVVPASLAFHYHPSVGGIRETSGQAHTKELWDHDEKLFRERINIWLPKPENKILKSLFDGYTPPSEKVQEKISVICLTHGSYHANFSKLIDGILKFTTHPYELIIVNNSADTESIRDIARISSEYKDRINLKTIICNDFPVGEARNEGVRQSDPNTKYICFIDDDALITGKYDSTSDWLDHMYSVFNSTKDVGAVSPIYTYYEPLQCHCVSVACLFTSKRVWNIVGGFDKIFGKMNQEEPQWGYEDCEWGYRCLAAGFKLLPTHSFAFPFFHEDTTIKTKSERQAIGLLNSEKLLLSKYSEDKINEYNRGGYPLTRAQREMKGPKVNVGSFYMHLDDFVNFDIQEVVRPEVCGDMRNIKNFFRPNSISLFLSSQNLEHINEDDALKFIKDCYDLLHPGGYLILEVPDCDEVEERFGAGVIDRNTHFVLLHGTPSEPYEEHLSTYTRSKLKGWLKEVGYVEITEMPLDKTSNMSEAIRIDSRKPI
jgi:glycosyltransferase involved in cell wall biosynthesis